MPGYLPGAGLAVKLVSVFDGNAAHGLPSHQAVIMLFDETTGEPVALMDGTHITAVRTAASAAVAARALARDGASTLAILGAGVQGASHLEAFSALFDVTDVRIASREPSSAQNLATAHPLARAVDSFEAAVRDADVVCCCTNAETPVIHREWLAAGTHVSSVGRGAEIDGPTIQEGTVFVEWRGAVTSPPPAGAVELQGCDPDRITEVGEVLAGSAPGRVSADQLTVYKSTGHAVEDAAAAALVYRNAKAAHFDISIRM